MNAGRERHIAAVTVTDQNGSTAVEESLQVPHLIGDRERTWVREGPRITPPVVAKHPEPMVQLPRQPRHSRRAVERSMDQNHQWCVGGTGFVTVDAVSGGCHMII